MVNFAIVECLGLVDFCVMNCFVSLWFAFCCLCLFWLVWFTVEVWLWDVVLLCALGVCYVHCLNCCLVEIGFVVWFAIL